jgi:hypothetical protein
MQRPCGAYEQVSKEKFERDLKDKLGELYPRALEIFRSFGPALSWQVTSVFFLACRSGNIEILNQAVRDLETFWTDRLFFLAPASRQPGLEMIQEFFASLHDRLI